MKKSQFIRVLVILIAVTGTLFLVETTIEKKVKNLEHGEFGKINSIMNQSLDEPIMIWGASTALVHFNPMIIEDSLALSAYNMGIDGTNIDQFYGLLKEYLDYTKNCKYLVIVLDIHGGLVDRDAIYNLHQWVPHLNNSNLYESFKDVDGLLALKCRWVPFYQLTLYNRTTFSCVKNEWIGKAETTLSDNKGFYPNDLPPIDTTTKAILELNPSQDQKSYLPINERSLRKVREACKLSFAKGIQPIIVIPPCYIRGLDRLGYQNQYMDSIYTLKNNHAIIFNYLNLEINSNPNLFYNNTHMNYRGANLLSSQFGSDMIRIMSNETQ